MKRKELTSKALEDLAKKVFKESPYPKYLGNGLYKLADNFIVGEKMMTKIIKGIAELLMEETLERAKRPTMK